MNGPGPGDGAIADAEDANGADGGRSSKDNSGARAEFERPSRLIRASANDKRSAHKLRTPTGDIVAAESRLPCIVDLQCSRIGDIEQRGV